MLSAAMLIGSSVFSVGSVVFPARSLVRVRWVGFAPGRVPGCSLVLASAFLHVISVKYLGYALEWSLVFGACLCWGGRGNVIFHGMQFPRESFIIDVSSVPLGHIRMWRVRLSWDSRVTCSRVSERTLGRERRSSRSLLIVL